MTADPALAADAELIDSHAHVDDGAFDADRDAVLARARAAGVTGLVCVGAGGDLEIARRAVALAGAVGSGGDSRPAVWATVGVHPHHAAAVSPGWWPELEALARQDRVVAVGETGLDYFYDSSPRDVQRDGFARSIDLARRVGLPVVCHIRDAHDDARRILRERDAGEVGGVIHCFTGTPEDALAYVDMGFYISFSGLVTFRGKRSDPIRAAARTVPADRILVETDCPYLAPEPHRGGRNEPAFVVETARAVAAARGVPAAELAALACANTRTLFALT